MDDLAIAIRGSFGFKLERGLKDRKVLREENLNPRDAFCRCFTFSNRGSYFAYCDTVRTVVVDASTGKELFEAELPKTQAIIFSPCDRYMVTYEPYVVYGTRVNDDGTYKTPPPNLRFWSLPDGKVITTHTADKQQNWKPQFSSDSRMTLRLVGSEILFYLDGSFDRFSKKAVIQNISSFEISPEQPPYLSVFIPPIKGQPAVIQLRSMQDDNLSIITSKITFNCDRCSMIWNSKGTALLAIASVEVDKTNQSYYGQNQLFCLTIAKCESFSVSLDKNGPIYCVKWAPSSKEFAVCYGFMPSKVSIYDLKGDVIWDLGSGHRNELHFNLDSIMAICSFGNLASGKIQLWNFSTRTIITELEVPHTTHFEFSPDGQYFCTSTTAPRLRTDNGYRIWYYTGEQIYEQQYDKEELWQMKWRPMSITKKFEIKETSIAQKQNSKAAGKAATVIDKLPPGAINKCGAYIPPHLRKGNPTGAASQQTQNIQGRSIVERSPEAEKQKKIRAVQKKLDDIRKLKDKLKTGAALEKNQEDKIHNEDKLVQELELLRTSS